MRERWKAADQLWQSAGWLALLLASACAFAQQTEPPNSLLLIARPTLLDPNFARTVVLVTQAQDASTVGVILNRPLPTKLQEILPNEPAAASYKDRVHQGGPVMRGVVLAVFRSDAVPAASAFPVLKGVYMTMHPENIKALLADPARGERRSYRLYLGFSGWAPRQLESEFMRDGWHVLPADAATVFRKDTEGMWEELLRKATKPRPTTMRNGFSRSIALQ